MKGPLWGWSNNENEFNEILVIDQDGQVLSHFVFCLISPQLAYQLFL